MSMSVIECYMPGQAGNFLRGTLGSVENLSNSRAVENLEEKICVAPTATQSQNQPLHPNLDNDEDYPNLEHKKATGNTNWLNVEEEKGWE